MATLAFYAVFLLGPPVVVAVRAHRGGRRLGAVAALTILAAAGGVVCGYGTLALAFNGYIEDNGSPPSRTLWLAIPLLLVGAAMILSAWLASRRG